MHKQKTLKEKHSALIMAHIMSIKHNVLQQDIIEDLERQLEECRNVIREQVEHIEL